MCRVAYLCTISAMQTLTEWVKTITDNASWRAIADELGTTHSTIQRRLKTDTASAVIELANAYNANPIYGLLAGGCITNADLEEFHRQSDLEDFSDIEVSMDIVRRLRDREQRSDLDATVFEFPSRQSARSDIPQDAVADDSDYHEEENTEFDD